MKRLGKRLLSGIFALVMISSLLCTAASASVKSSAYLDAYRAMLTADPNGSMVITVDVTAVGRKPELGVKTIYVYESTDGKTFNWIRTYESEDYPEMMGSGIIFYEDVITFQGVIGRYYYAKAFVYAGDSTGGDERYCNTAIRQAKA
ncbi:hypothetical protein [uncultured Oscillibacter sp.]|uniref:hypothetical protein n=1 Tax=uncultured Oscillibacter sp. TaxID=876091 RepID=UPI00260F58A8|nr:hypothetical protein [uncultured Oscillibacter sp.]